MLGMFETRFVAISYNLQYVRAGKVNELMCVCETKKEHICRAFQKLTYGL